MNNMWMERTFQYGVIAPTPWNYIIDNGPDEHLEYSSDPEHPDELFTLRPYFHTGSERPSMHARYLRLAPDCAYFSWGNEYVMLSEERHPEGKHRHVFNVIVNVPDETRITHTSRWPNGIVTGCIVAYTCRATLERNDDGTFSRISFATDLPDVIYFDHLRRLAKVEKFLADSYARKEAGKQPILAFERRKK